MTKRIPENLPFIVRPSVGRRLTLFGPLALTIIVPLLFLLTVTLTAGGPQDSTSGDMVALVVLSFCLLVPIIGGFGLQVFLLASGGPVLAVGPAGLWIKTRPTRGQAIWLPWEGIERITRRRWSFEKMVVVKPRDPRASTGLGAFTAVDSSLLKLFYGSGFTATLNFGDRREPEIMAAIRHFSAGRTFIAN